jgi:hypothetical protein
MAQSSSDTIFLAESWRRQGKLFTDAPAVVKAAFQAACVLPTVVKALVLPSDHASVSALVHVELPSVTNVDPIPNPLSYFQDLPPPSNTGFLTLLKTLPIPPPNQIKLLQEHAGQAWLDGKQSLMYSHTDNPHLFSFWIVTFWNSVTEIIPAHRAWTAANVYLLAQQRKSSERSRRVGDAFRTILHELPWRGQVHGFSDHCEVHILSKFLSKDWLADIHETFLLEILRSRVLSTELFGSEHDIATIWTSKKIRIAHENRETNKYIPSSRTDIAQLGSDLVNSKKTRVGMLWHINENHWTSMVINMLTARILYGDPFGSNAPAWLQDAVIWWLSQHVTQPFEWGVLECTAQNDGFSCGILAQNALRHEFLPNDYPLIKTSEVSLARMELGLEVIRHHIRMVSDLKVLCMAVTPYTFSRRRSLLW